MEPRIKFIRRIKRVDFEIMCCVYECEAPTAQSSSAVDGASRSWWVLTLCEDT